MGIRNPELTVEYVQELKRIIASLEAENKQLKARVIGNPARNLPPPAPIAATNETYWGIDTVQDPAAPPIKCHNCEE